jgi:hypothetical protein
MCFRSLDRQCREPMSVRFAQDLRLERFPRSPVLPWFLAAAFLVLGWAGPHFGKFETRLAWSDASAGSPQSGTSCPALPARDAPSSAVVESVLADSDGSDLDADDKAGRPLPAHYGSRPAADPRIRAARPQADLRPVIARTFRARAPPSLTT